MNTIKKIIIKLFWIKVFNFILKLYKKGIFLKNIFNYYKSKMLLWGYHTFKNYNEISIKNKNVFFWYYEKQPFNKESNKILCISTNKNISLYKNWLEADILIYNIKSKTFEKIWVTKTRNTQMWCRLHWFNEDKNLIIYNDLIKWNYWTVIKNIKENKIVRNLPLAMYDISKNKDYILSLDFSRLETLRPWYWYNNIKDNTKNKKIPENNWIWLYNLNNNKLELLINLKDIIWINYLDNMEGAFHYINHISCNKYDNNSFIFFHLWRNEKWKYSRAISYDLIKKELKIINKWLMVSHYDWKNKDEILIYSKENKKNNFNLYNIRNWKTTIIWNNLLNEDWHQTYYKDKNKILLDTYPNKDSFQKLFIFNSKKNNIRHIWKVLHYPQINDSTRTDLHPRLSPNEKMFCIDSNFNWSRSVIVWKI